MVKLTPISPVVLEKYMLKLEDLKVLRRSPDLFYYVKIGQGFTANI